MSVIHGTVLDAAGQPAASARAAFVDGPGVWPDVAALTDAAGRFALAAPQPGVYRIGCFADDGEASAEVRVEVASVDVAVRIRLRRRGG